MNQKFKTKDQLQNTRYISELNNKAFILYLNDF